MRIRKSCLAILLIFIFALSLFAQDNAKKVLNIEDYGRWRSVGSAAISGDGNWITYVYSLREKDDTLYVKNLVNDKIYQIPLGSGPKFSDDSRWVAYTLNKPQKEKKKLQKDKKPVPKKAELLNLTTGEKYAVDNMSSFTFSKASNYLAVKKSKSDPKAKHKGTNLLLRNLKTGMNELLGGVSEFSFNKPGTKLAYLIEVPDTSANGAHLIDLNTGVRKPLDSGRALYSRLTWDEEGVVLAVLRGLKDKKKKNRDNLLLAFTGLDLRRPKRHQYDPAKAGDFPKDMVISEKGTRLWRSD